jgi:hypothetical protein
MEWNSCEHGRSLLGGCQDCQADAEEKAQVWEEIAEDLLEYTEGAICWDKKCTRKSCHEIRTRIEEAREL